MIRNNALRANEKQWIEAMLTENVPYREQIIAQINCAEIHREYADYDLSMRFEVNPAAAPIHATTRVPIEMRVFKPEQVPTQFLLHIIQGFISELEIFNADSSEISPDLTLDNARIEIIIDE